MKQTLVLFTKSGTNCYELNLPMDTRVKERVDKVGTAYIKAFWVGLLEGDGSIKTSLVNYGTTVSYGMEIEQDYYPETEVMHHAIVTVLGGQVTILRENEGRPRPRIKWETNDLAVVKEFIKVLEESPPLITQSSGRFALRQKVVAKRDLYLRGGCTMEELVSFTKKGLETCFDGRGQYWRSSYKDIPYFEAWLSGFMGAEGCWAFTTSISTQGTESKAVRFLINQKYEQYILEFIRDYCGAVKSKITRREEDLFVFEVVNRPSIDVLHRHVHKYPLLGVKGSQFQAHFDFIRTKRTNQIKSVYYTFQIPEDSLFMQIPQGSPYTQGKKKDS